MDSTVASAVSMLVMTISIGGLAAFWVAALVSISRRSSRMTGVELIGWYALVVFAQVIGTLIWFFVGRDRYPTLSASPRSFDGTAQNR